MGLTGISGPSGLSAIMGGGNGGGCTATINRSRQYTRANNEYHTVAHDASLSKGDTAWCAHVDVYIDSDPVSYLTVFAKDDNAAGNREYSLLAVNADNAQKPTFSVFDGTSVVGTVSWGTALSLATWYHIKVRHDPVANVVGINVDNGTEVTAATTGAAGSGTAKFSVGVMHNGAAALAMDGRIQQLLIFDENTSAADDALIYNAGAGGDYENLGLAASPAQAWRANEESGNLIAAAGGIDLTDTNTVTSATGHFLSCA